MIFCTPMRTPCYLGLLIETVLKFVAFEHTRVLLPTSGPILDVQTSLLADRRNDYFLLLYFMMRMEASLICVELKSC
jgi:hypothetical protein